jgi:CHAD domain-containing protein
MPRSAAAAIRESVRRCVDQLLVAEPLIRDDRPLPDGDTPVHAARVACRRLRSDLRTFRQLLDPGWAGQLRGELKWFAGLLGAARDAEVLRARLRANAAELDPDDITALDAALAAQTAAAGAQLAAALDDERHRRLLAALTAATRDLPLRARAARPARDVLPRLVERPWRVLERAAAELTVDASDEQWHAVRILTKRARYAADATAGKVPGARRRAKKLAGVQKVLGEHQDAVVAGQTWLELSAAAPLTAGRLIERERAAARQARAAFPAAWRACEH